MNRTERKPDQCCPVDLMNIGNIRQIDLGGECGHPLSGNWICEGPGPRPWFGCRLTSTRHSYVGDLGMTIIRDRKLVNCGELYVVGVPELEYTPQLESDRLMDLGS